MKINGVPVLVVLPVVATLASCSTGSDGTMSSTTSAPTVTVTAPVSPSASASEQPTGPASLGTPQEAAGRKFTVYKVVNPYQSSTFQRPGKGKQFAVVDVKACSVAKKVMFNSLDWTVDDRSGRNWTIFDSSTGARDPDLGMQTMPGTEFPPNTCHRGWYTFQIDRGTHLKTVTWNGKEFSGETLGTLTWQAS